MSAMTDQVYLAYKTKEEREMAELVSKTMYRYDQPAADRITSTDQVTDADLLRFWQQGYLVIDRVFSEQEVQIALEAIMDIVFERVKGPQVQYVKPRNQLKDDRERELATRKIANFVEHEPRLRALSDDPTLFGLIEQLFKGKSKLVQDIAFLKPPHGGVEKPWHQDMAYGNMAYEKPVIGVWVALDEATIDNGCMHIIPRSHMGGPVPHYSVRDWQICDTNVPVDKDVVVPLKPGGALIFHGMLLHGTPPNFSEQRRRSVQFHYALESAEKLTPKEYVRWFTNEMTNAEC